MTQLVKLDVIKGKLESLQAMCNDDASTGAEVLEFTNRIIKEVATIGLEDEDLAVRGFCFVICNDLKNTLEALNGAIS